MYKITAFLIIVFLAASADLHAVHEKIIVDNNEYLSVNRSTGFEISRDSGKSWSSKNQGLPAKIVYPFTGSEIRKITSLNINPDNALSLSLTTINSLYLSADRGETWERTALASPMRNTFYYTASAVSSKNSSRILLGTSFSGLFESSDRGKTWKSLTGIMNRFAKGAGFYEDISAVAYGSGKFYLFTALGFSKELYGYTGGNTGSGEWIRIPVPLDAEGKSITSLVYDTENRKLSVYAGNNLYLLDTESMAWDKDITILPYPKKTENREALNRIAAAGDKTGIYVSAVNAAGGRLERYLDFIKAHRMNSIVIDFKDDNGVITYKTDLEMPYRVNAVNPILNVEEIVKKAHSQNIYVIARLVVFKDMKLFNYSSAEYAVWDRIDKKPWGYFVKADEETYEQREFWVDPFSGDVWDYNISIARELQEAGVDEIQFDYIRFPTDGTLSRIEYRHRREGMLHSEALESFFKKARESISLPISTDLYGFNSWYKKGNWNGQQVDMIADYADVISPMYYPSHFPSSFLSSLSYMDKAYRIYREGTERTIDIAAGRSIVRPYVQAFLIGNERNFEKPVYTRYLNLQLEGLFDADASGYTLWNASGNYYMVDSSMPVKIDSGS